jgi:ATP-binding cassette subfamily D (ALD) long-chain fatty acid import protein
MAPTQSKPVALGSSAVARARTIRGIVSQLTTMYLRNRTKISRAVSITLLVALVQRIRHSIAEQKAAAAREDAKKAAKAGSTSAAAEEDEVEVKKKRVELNREFFRQLMRLLRILVPGWRTKEMRLLITHSFFLVMRTLISLKVAAMDGAIVKALIKGNGREFLMRIVWWMLIAVPATFTNSMLSYHQAELALRYRTRLTEYIHNQYLSNLTFYGISALDDRIKNPDQLIAVDVARFSNSLAELFSNLAKPILDMVRFPSTYLLSHPFVHWLTTLDNLHNLAIKERWRRGRNLHGASRPALCARNASLDTAIR